MTKISVEIDIDAGNLSREEQVNLLTELLQTMPDRDIAHCIDLHGTIELCEFITPWIIENNPELAVAPAELDIDITLEDVEAANDKGV